MIDKLNKPATRRDIKDHYNEIGMSSNANTNAERQIGPDAPPKGHTARTMASWLAENGSGKSTRDARIHHDA